MINQADVKAAHKMPCMKTFIKKYPQQTNYPDRFTPAADYYPVLLPSWPWPLLQCPYTPQSIPVGLRWHMSGPSITWWITSLVGYPPHTHTHTHTQPSPPHTHTYPEQEHTTRVFQGNLLWIKCNDESRQHSKNDLKASVWIPWLPWRKWVFCSRKQSITCKKLQRTREHWTSNFRVRTTYNLQLTLQLGHLSFMVLYVHKNHKAY